MPSFRLATPADLPGIKPLVESAYRGDAARAGWTNEADLLTGERISATELAATLAAPANRLILAETDGALIGTVTLTDHGNGKTYLGMLAVDPTQQASGLGRALLAQAETQARAIGATLVEMTVISARPELIAYYERRGYARTGEIRPFPDPAITHLSMVVLAKPLG
jgi:ribosomal protein S18 acetylase RimI-like enzyme